MTSKNTKIIKKSDVANKILSWGTESESVVKKSEHFVRNSESMTKNSEECDTDYTSTDCSSVADSEDPPSDTDLSVNIKEQFSELMSQYKKYSDKMVEINEAKRLLSEKISSVGEELKKLMISSNLNEVTYGAHKFVVEDKESSTKVTPKNLRIIAESVVGDVEKVEKIFSIAESMKKTTHSTKLKYVKA